MSTNNPIRDTTPLHSEMSVPPPPSTAVHVAGMMIQPTSPPYMLEPLLETIRTSQTLSDEVLKELAHLFPSTTLVHALELLDKEKIIKYIAQPSQRELFAVEPSHRSSGGGGGGASLSHHHCHKPSTPLNNNKMTTNNTRIFNNHIQILQVYFS
ncbi:hypothetical protein C9374_002714 [Naegleria lovaniensis]|uniref:Uncharacterized protein n=1 Tax=Naegleria lovaniensis TaxID=51637 RepID=A0AA88GU03_NAELO|nr:uncharacterized protein C9374_002714 [Naegleria lovaniensis]KAG2386268.1 hypothetical protein C9374_002714 [Naegleria lovaniensis]